MPPEIDPARNALRIAADIQRDVRARLGPPEEGYPSGADVVVPRALVRNTRVYIERIANQANGCYDRGWYDGCAVMLRRLIETLIIECYEHHKISNKIQDANGDFFFLRDLISAALSEPTWNLGRNAKSALGKLKSVGDRSAHSRRYVANRRDIELLQDDVRVVVQELVFLAGLK